MRKLSDVLRRICALALCLCMMAQYMPMAGFAEEGAEAVAEAVEETTEPTEATTEPMEATTAPTEETTEPTEETTVPTEETTEPAEATEAETAGKTVTAWTWVEPEEEEDRILDPETGEVYLSTTQEDPIPMELLTAALPAAILARVEDAEETVTLGPWTCEDYPAEGAYAGDYTFVTTLPEGYTLAEGVAALEVMVHFAEPEMLAGGLVNSEAALKTALRSAQSGDIITLATDINVTESITISGQNITLDLNGKTLTYSGKGSAYTPYGVFTLKSGSFTVENGTLKGQQQENIRCFNVTGGTLTIKKVTIQNFSCQGGGAISIDRGGTCIMKSGTISGNSAWDEGGGVYVRGTFNMTGGTISGNNVSSGSGGGVYVRGTFNMTGGTISGNNAQSGGGVYVYSNGTFTMNGGEIRNNTADNNSVGNGGGVAVFGGSFTMTSGTISDNTAKENGGGVYVDKNSFTMEGGTITNNTADAVGGGVCMYSGSFIMSGGSITGNQAGGDGKGVSIGGSVSCHLSGGAKIAENTGNGTGNLYINTGGKPDRSITNLAAGAQLDIYFSREADAKVATGDKQSLDYLTCENAGYVFTLENANELWVKWNRMAIITQPTGQKDLKYDGTSHVLVDAGTAGTGGTMLYAVGTNQPKEDAFSKNLPSGTNAGTYTVWYYAKGVGDKADSDMERLNVTIAPKSLTVTGTTVKDKTYDGTDRADIGEPGQLDGVYGKDANQVTLVQGKGYFENKNAGQQTVAFFGFALTGDRAKNYTLTQPSPITASIEPKKLQGVLTVGDITYGEPINSSVTWSSGGKPVATDKVDVKLEYEGTNGTDYSRTETPPTNAGTYTAKPFITDSNYSLQMDSVKFTIAPKDITGASVTLAKPTQTYTGQKLTNAVTGVTIDGLTLGKDDYTVSGTENATDVGTYTLTVTGTGNFTGEAFATWEIQAADNTWIEEPSVTDWTYGDAPTVNAGTPRFGTVTVKYFTHDGEALGSTVPTDAGDYRAVFKVVEDSNFKDLSETVDFTISKRALTVTANPKTVTYGDEPANDGVIYDGFVNGEDEKALKGTLDFDYDYKQYDKVGSYTITPKGLTSGNYDITFTKGTLTVERKNVTIQDVAVEVSKVYDGTTVAAITHNGSLSANFDGENLTFQVGTAAYDDKSAGEDKTVTFSGFSLEGSAAGNYRLTGQPGEVTASIAPMPVALTATVKDKTYDGTLTAELGTVTHSGFVAGDDVQMVNGTPSFSSGDKGENIQVTFTPFTLTGKDAGNYALTQPTGVKARISPKPVTVSGITAQDKTYDGNTQVTFVYEGALLEGNVDGDKLTVTVQGSFENANVGNAKRVNITGLTLGGAEQGNYVLAESGQQTGTTAAITANDRYLDLSGLDLGGDAGTVWIDGEKEPINTSGGSHILLPKEAGLLTTYTYKQNDSGDDYPIGMRVYRFQREDTGVTLTEITEFENLLNYAGCSIRLSGKKGIRMITGISQDNKKALTSKAGLSGYTLEEYGTVVMRGVGTPTLENSKSHNFAYKKGKADPIFSRVDGMIQYTNVLVGFSLDDCKDTLTLRPYIILKDTATGETVTLYGGCVCRSIYQVAQQNENTYKPGTAGYKYIHEILDYSPTAEQGGKTK